MMPNMAEGLRGLTRRTKIQVIKQKVVDHEAVEAGVDLEEISIVLTPTPAQKIAIKPEGQRAWKWWTGSTTAKLDLGWMLRDPKDGRLFEVMEKSDWGQAGFFVYELTEAPK